MYSNAKIPEPFCRRVNGAAADAAPSAPTAKQAAPESAAVSASEADASPAKTQASASQPDSLPLLAFLMMELFR